MTTSMTTPVIADWKLKQEQDLQSIRRIAQKIDRLLTQPSNANDGRGE